MPKHAAAKKKRSVKAYVFMLIIILLVGVLCFSTYKFFSEYIPQAREQERFGELRGLIGDDDASSDADGKLKSSKYEKLFGMNEDMRGWLKIDGTEIDYPVMKNDLEDGEYYLHRDFDGNSSFAGCLFFGINCDEDSDISIIYGHNMNNGSMFGKLTSYADKAYAEEHRYISLDTKDESRVYKVFASFSAKAYAEDDTSGDFKYYENVGDISEEQYSYILDRYKEMSDVWMDDVPEYPEKILLLSTCSYHTDNGRFVVAAYRVK